MGYREALLLFNPIPSTAKIFTEPCAKEGGEIETVLKTSGYCAAITNADMPSAASSRRIPSA